MASSTPTPVTPFSHDVERFRVGRKPDEIEALAQFLAKQAEQGWEIADVGGDSLDRPYFVFKKASDEAKSITYIVEKLDGPRGEDKLLTLKNKLDERLTDNWIAACVLDSKDQAPIVVFKKSTQPNLTFKFVNVPVTALERTAADITRHLISEQKEANLTLSCVITFRGNPTLIMVSKETDGPYLYLVESAAGTLAAAETGPLLELIDERTTEGWEVCGAFEDATTMSTLVFRKIDNLSSVH